MREFRPHIVHTHTAKAGTLDGWQHDFARVPCRWSILHGHVFHGYFLRQKTRLFNRHRALARTRHTDRLLTVSENVAGTTRSRVGSQKRFTVIPLGLDLDRFLSVRDAGQYELN